MSSETELRIKLVQHMMLHKIGRHDATIAADLIVLAATRAIEGLIDISQRTENETQKSLVLGMGPTVIEIFGRLGAENAIKIMKETFGG